MKSPRILVVDDESNIRGLIEEILTEEGYSVTTAADASEAREARRRRDYDLTLLDIWMPDTDGISLLKEWSDEGSLGAVVMMSGHGTVDTAVEATRLGALDFIEKPVSLAKLLRTVEKALSRRRSRDMRKSMVEPILTPVGKSESMRALREQVARVARHDAHAVMVGEPGSGRQTAARFLASRSERSRDSFVAVSGADLTEVDFKRRLLGSGERPGALERASGGILFISDVSEMCEGAQQLMLSLLEQGRFGSARGGAGEQLDVRIIASAPPGFERDEMTRQDFLARLDVVVIRVPPLREHPEDVPELLRYHADLLVDSEDLPFRRFSVAAQNRLRNYPWPGNIRELRNLVNRLLILGGPEEISLTEVESQLNAEAPEGEPLIKQDLLALPLREAREHFERAYLQQQLILCGGKVGQLAKRVGMERTHLYRKLRALGVDFRQSASDD